MKAILIDDEQKALDALHWQLTSFCPSVQVVASCTDTAKALDAIGKWAPDVVFLDIEMPVQNGFDLLAQFHTIPFEVIFTTAYDQFALKAIKFSALDYLLKPIDPEELQVAVKKLEQKTQRGLQPTQVEAVVYNYLRQQNKASRFAIPSAEGLLFIEAEDIVRCESDSNYTRVYLIDGQKVVLAKTLKEVEALLEGFGFFRVHHSHLINIRHIKKLIKKEGGIVLMQDHAEVNIARNRKEQFMELFKKL